MARRLPSYTVRLLYGYYPDEPDHPLIEQSVYTRRFNDYTDARDYAKTLANVLMQGDPELVEVKQGKEHIHLFGPGGISMQPRQTSRRKRATKIENPSWKPQSRGNPSFPGRLGTGQRFAACVTRMEDKPGVYDSEGLCAAIGRRKYGSKGMARLAAGGRQRNPKMSRSEYRYIGVGQPYTFKGYYGVLDTHTDKLVRSGFRTKTAAHEAAIKMEDEMQRPFRGGREQRRSNPTKSGSRYGVYVGPTLAYVTTRKLDANKAASKLKLSGRKGIAIKSVGPNPVSGKVPKIGWREAYKKAAYAAIKAPKTKRAANPWRNRNSRSGAYRNPSTATKRRSSRVEYVIYPDGLSVFGLVNARKRAKAIAKRDGYATIQKQSTGENIETVYEDGSRKRNPNKRNAASVLVRENSKRGGASRSLLRWTQQRPPDSKRHAEVNDGHVVYYAVIGPRMTESGVEREFLKGYSFRDGGSKAELLRSMDVYIHEPERRNPRRSSVRRTANSNRSRNAASVLVRRRNSSGKRNPDYLRGRSGYLWDGGPERPRPKRSTKYPIRVNALINGKTKLAGYFSSEQAAEKYINWMDESGEGRDYYYIASGVRRNPTSARRKSNPTTGNKRKAYVVYAGKQTAWVGSTANAAKKVMADLQNAGRTAISGFEALIPKSVKMGWRSAFVN